jgi:Xaa-Pro aminopeptidase
MLLNEARLEKVLAENSLDAVIGTSPENVLYLSDYWAMSQWVRRGPQAYVLRPRSDVGRAAVITNTSLLDLVADQDIQPEVRRYAYFKTDIDETATLSAADARHVALFNGEGYGGPVEALASAIRDRGLASARIGIDEIGITPQCMEQLTATFPDAVFVRAFALMEKVRAIKTPEEIIRLRRAASISEQSVDAALAAAKVGMTEIEMARVFHSTTTILDGVPVTGCIGFGDRSAMSNVQPSEQALKMGDAIRFDVGCRYKYYRSDISRIAFMGEPSAKLRNYHNALYRGVQRAYEILKPGVKVADLFEAVVATVRQEGIPHYARSHVGHGIGIEGYDPPNIAGNSADVFEENMVICVETPYYELGFAGLQVEDMILVTRDGAESLMARDGRLRVLG